MNASPPFLDSYKIQLDGGSGVLTLRDDNGTEIVVRLGPVEAHAMSDALLEASAQMVLARQGGRNVPTPKPL